MKNISFFYRACLSALLIAVLFFCGKLLVSADTGVKPSIRIQLIQPPEEHYYVALLEYSSTICDKEVRETLESVDEKSVESFLMGFSEDGWYFYQSPVGANILQSNPEHSYYFHYMVPKPFRVIVITEDGGVFVSDALEQKEYNAECTYDVSSGALTEDRNHKVLKRILYIFLCFAMTVIAELAVLKPFGFPLSKRNVISLFIVNALTNIPYNLFMVNNPPGFGRMMVGLFLEFLILVAEGIGYSILLKDEGGRRTPGNSFAYSAVANILSAMLGCVASFFYMIVMW